MTLWLADVSDGTMTPFSPGEAWLSRVLVARVDGDVRALQRCLEAHEGAPWRPVCLQVHDAQLTAAFCEALRALPPTYCALRHGAETARIAVGSILAAIDARPRPGHRELGAYLDRRVMSDSYRRLLLACVHPPRPVPARRWRAIDRELRSATRLKGRDWRFLPVLAGQWPEVRTAPERAAWDLNIDPRTLRGRLKRLTGLAPGEARGLAGWESVVERTLRRSGLPLGTQMPEALRERTGPPEAH